MSLVPAALELSGRPSDFADAIRPAPYGVAKPYGSVGVLYLEAYRASLRRFGATVFGVRFLLGARGRRSRSSTGALLGRALLPAGGGTLAALALAGMRWHLILSRWAWNMIALVPIVDLATLAVAAARRRRSTGLAAAGGAVAGVGAHVYLAAWPAAAALGLFAMWPSERGEPRRAGSRAGRGVRRRVPRRRRRRSSSSARGGPRPTSPAPPTTTFGWRWTRTRSLMPPFAAAADALAAPWLIPDPIPRHDLPGRSRLGLLLGVPVAIALARALLRPRDGISALLLAHGIAVLAATVAGGQADNPNGARFAYLTTVAAVSVAAGAPVARRPRARIAAPRTAALARSGCSPSSGALGARDALADWPAAAETFDGFHGQDTLIGRAAARWDALRRRSRSRPGSATRR